MCYKGNSISLKQKTPDHPPCGTSGQEALAAGTLLRAGYGPVLSGLVCRLLDLNGRLISRLLPASPPLPASLLTLAPKGPQAQKSPSAMRDGLQVHLTSVQMAQLQGTGVYRLR